MIVPMIKYNFLVHHSAADMFLEKLAEAGVMDIQVSDYELSEGEVKLSGEITALAKVVDALATVKEQAQKNGISLPVCDLSAQDAVAKYGEAVSAIEQLSSRASKLSKELVEAQMWGDFSHEAIEQLQESGLYLHFYMALAKELEDESLNSRYTTYTIGERGGMVLFAIITRDASEPTQLGNLAPMRLPSYTYSQKREELSGVQDEIEANKATINAISSIVDKITDYKLSLEEQLDFSKARSTSQSAAEGHLSLIQGWVPEADSAQMDSRFESMSSIIMVKEKPTLEDEPPVKLKNGTFARMAELITNLYSLPRYHAVDLTPYYAPWFIFFVGICFADIFYGMVTLALGIYLSTKSTSETMKLTGRLVTWCSASTIIMGFITGNAGGLVISQWEMFEPISWIFLGQTDMFYFALGVGILQILYGMCVKAYTRGKRFGFLYSLSTIGWASVIVASILANALPHIGVDFTMDSTAYKAILYTGLAMSVLMHDPKNILKGSGAGLWQLYNSVTGLFSDTLSYVRLFALGLSGAIIASVFNDLAVGMSGDIPVVKYIIMTIILLIGHGINLFMSAIGSFVHPLRLTFVEFYNNADFEAGGRGYDPFKRKSQDKKE